MGFEVLQGVSSQEVFRHLVFQGRFTHPRIVLGFGLVVRDLRASLSEFSSVFVGLSCLLPKSLIVRVLLLFPCQASAHDLVQVRLAGDRGKVLAAGVFLGGLCGRVGAFGHVCPSFPHR